ncbi:hypothetical protein E4U17_005629 [Claviceps sp. LM77 group G4]|nr:hypothetical protein E4U17_005629 [Claviceps sp. LM77 group G4]KAG6070845.1 hypothetical protein E4U33_004015 [Claviceps sp. LM78 group G4]KAG6073950.1 hypothetical protein E4U16_004315 [Claviceps sp. LM84 group G4]
MTTSVPAGRKRLVHHLDTPFSTVAWPEVSVDDQDTILELLCNLLSPIGQHRRTHLKASQGKREAKRKASAKLVAPEVGVTKPKPELVDYVDVGFNAITRGLESMSSGTQAIHAGQSSENSYKMIFVSRGTQSAAFNCHFPKLVGVASRMCASTEDIKLIGFSKSCSERLAENLGIARVSCLAIKKDAPGAQALWTFVSGHVASVDIAWLDNTRSIQYKPTQIAAVETKIGPKKVKTSQVS